MQILITMLSLNLKMIEMLYLKLGWWYFQLFFCCLISFLVTKLIKDN